MRLFVSDPSHQALPLPPIADDKLLYESYDQFTSVLLTNELCNKYEDMSKKYEDMSKKCEDMQKAEKWIRESLLNQFLLLMKSISIVY